MRNTMKSLAVLLVSGALFSASAMAGESLSQKAGQAWDSASQSAEDLGKQAEQKFDGAVKDASLLVDDSTITAKIRGQLLSADDIDSNDIAVKTINGTVYLSPDLLPQMRSVQKSSILPKAFPVSVPWKSVSGSINNRQVICAGGRAGWERISR